MNASPMFQQYRELKAAHPDAILFFRMGDFYETFFEDAAVAARELELTLTSRNKNDDEPIPMAGVPHHAAAGYVQKLVERGYRVAIAEQMEDPALAKGLVRRAIVRIVTPGVVLDPTALEARQAVWLVGICADRDRYGIAALDSSTGDLRATTVDGVDAAIAEVHRLQPREVLIPPTLVTPALEEAFRRHGARRSPVEDEAWERREAVREVRAALGVADTGSFGLAESDPAVRAVGAVLRYARTMAKGALDNVHTLRVYRPAGFMVVDDTTRRNLEIDRTLLGGHRKGSLLWLLDRTATAAGGRKLREWLAFPLLEADAIQERQRGVGALVDEAEAREALRTALAQVADIERIGARVAQDTATPRDLGALRRSLRAVPQVLAVLADLRPMQPWVPANPCADVRADLDAWLVDEPPLTIGDGDALRRGVHPELDELYRMAVDGLAVMARFEEKERAASGISTLKVRRNDALGYFLEVSRAQAHKAPPRWVRRQTLTNGERYVTPELKELEERVLGAEERRRALEIALFAELRARVAAAGERLQGLARALAAVDALSGLAEVAVERRWVRPDVDDTLRLDIKGGRHPVVEALLQDERFVPNDVFLSAEKADARRLVVLTGPNMAGKSTVLRQTAIVVLLAQIGSFVPADSAAVGLADRIFTRVGAVDDLSRGQSTFMVEMAETAAILHHATSRSLVILDEIGRGTSTYDGLSIAWAVAEDLATRIGCRALFATHYHELCDLAEQREGVVNQSVAVHESGDRIVFLRRLKDGGASRSYGIQCARIAGLPQPVVDRARELLQRFEKHAPRNERHQLSLFGVLGESAPEPPPDPIRAALADIDPDALSPRQAHEALYRLKHLT